MRELGESVRGWISEGSSYELSTSPFPVPLLCSGVESQCEVSETEAGEKEGGLGCFSFCFISHHPVSISSISIFEISNNTRTILKLM